MINILFRFLIYINNLLCGEIIPVGTAGQIMWKQDVFYFFIGMLIEISEWKRRNLALFFFKLIGVANL